MVNIDCRSCGAEAELYKGGHCWTCVLAETVDSLLTNPRTGAIAEDLIPMAAALKSMERSNSGLTWVRQAHVTAFLRELAIAPSISHDTLDGLPHSPTREYVRQLLVQHGSLPERDIYRARYQQWATQALERVTDPANREIILRYVRWHHVRLMNESSSVSPGTFLRSKQTVTVAIELVNWLTEHKVGLGTLVQADLDAWVNEGTTTRLVGIRFLNWAIKARLVNPELTIRDHRRGISPQMSASEQKDVLEQVIHTDELSPRDRAAAILVLVFGQQMSDIVQLTWGDIRIDDECVVVKLGKTEVSLPAPIDSPWRQLAGDSNKRLTSSHSKDHWVFPGHSPGRHIYAGHLTERLREVFQTRAARLGTLHELTKLAPVAIIADALGYSPKTIERHAVDASAAYAAYIAARRRV